MRQVWVRLIVIMFFAPTLGLAGSAAAAEDAPVVVKGGAYVFAGNAGDAARFEFDAGSDVYGVLFDPQGVPFDIRTSRGSANPFVLTEDGTWVFELRRYDGIAWPRGPGAPLPLSYTAQVWTPGDAVASRSTAPGHALEARWTTPQDVTAFVGVTLAEDHVQETTSVHVLVESVVNGVRHESRFVSSTQTLGRSVATPGARVDVSAVELPAPLSARHLLRFTVYDVVGELRISAYALDGFPLTDVTFLASGEHARAYAALDDVVLWGDAELAQESGVATPVASASAGATRDLDVPERFFGLFKTWGADGWIESPDGTREAVSDDARFIDDGAAGRWTFHVGATASAGLAHRYYLQGVLAPDFGLLTAA